LPGLNPHQGLERSTIKLCRAAKAAEQNDSGFARRCLHTRSFALIEINRLVVEGDEGHHSCGLIPLRLLGLLRIGRPALFEVGKPADLGKHQSMLSGKAREASKERLLRLGA
jgi:hypothetical protein